MRTIKRYLNCSMRSNRTKKSVFGVFDFPSFRRLNTPGYCSYWKPCLCRHRSCQRLNCGQLFPQQPLTISSCAISVGFHRTVWNTSSRFVSLQAKKKKPCCKSKPCTRETSRPINTRQDGSRASTAMKVRNTFTGTIARRRSGRSSPHNTARVMK